MELPTILYVDDDIMMHDLIVPFLESRFKIISAYTGVQALCYYEQLADRIVLVVTDVQMPEMDGIRLVEELRARKANIPVIIVSAIDRAAVPSAWCSEHGVHWLPKPVRMREIATIAHTLISPPNAPLRIGAV